MKIPTFTLLLITANASLISAGDIWYANREINTGSYALTSGDSNEKEIPETFYVGLFSKKWWKLSPIKEDRVVAAEVDGPALSFNFSKTPIVSSDVYLKAYTRGWFGIRRTIGRSADFRLLRVGAQPKVPRDYQVISRIDVVAKSDAAYGMKNGLELHVKLLKPLKKGRRILFELMNAGTDQKLNIKALYESTDGSRKTDLVIEIDAPQIAVEVTVTAYARIPSRFNIQHLLFRTAPVSIDFYDYDSTAISGYASDDEESPDGNSDSSDSPPYSSDPSESEAEGLPTDSSVNHNSKPQSLGDFLMKSPASHSLPSDYDKLSSDDEADPETHDEGEGMQSAQIRPFPHTDSADLQKLADRYENELPETESAARESSFTKHLHTLPKLKVTNDDDFASQPSSSGSFHSISSHFIPLNEFSNSADESFSGFDNLEGNGKETPNRPFNHVMHEQALSSIIPQNKQVRWANPLCQTKLLTADSDDDDFPVVYRPKGRGSFEELCTEE